jgi:hypothetical protein
MSNNDANYFNFWLGLVIGAFFVFFLTIQMVTTGGHSAYVVPSHIHPGTCHVALDGNGLDFPLTENIQCGLANELAASYNRQFWADRKER